MPDEPGAQYAAAVHRSSRSPIWPITDATACVGDTLPVTRWFEITANPDPDSTLPWLLRLPLGPDGLVLKARDTWPRTAKIYCHRAEPTAWPTDPASVERVAVKVCERSGVAVDLVLDRGKENRSQIVFARLAGGREAIFWQTARTVRTVRPGLRTPGRRAGGLAELAITVDTRERYAYKFAGKQVVLTKSAMPVGDYGTFSGESLVAVVERKSIDDLAASLSNGKLAFQLAALGAVKHAAVVVEGRWSALVARPRVQPGFLAEELARLAVRYPSVPVHFLESRLLAEDWTYRFLGAALVMHEEHPADPTAPRAPAPGR